MPSSSSLGETCPVQMCCRAGDAALERSPSAPACPSCCCPDSFWTPSSEHLKSTLPHILLLDCPGHYLARLDTACAVTRHILRCAHLIPSLSPPVPGDSTGRRQRHGDTTTGTVPWGSTVPAAAVGLRAPGTPRIRSRAEPAGTGGSWSSRRQQDGQQSNRGGFPCTQQSPGH